MKLDISTSELNSLLGQFKPNADELIRLREEIRFLKEKNQNEKYQEQERHREALQRAEEKRIKVSDQLQDAKSDAARMRGELDALNLQLDRERVKSARLAGILFARNEQLEEFKNRVVAYQELSRRFGYRLEEPPPVDRKVLDDFKAVVEAENGEVK